MRTGVIWKFIGQTGTQATRLITVAVLARLLHPADYGAAAIAVTLAAFAPSLGDMGMGSALVQTDRENQQVRSTAFWGSVAFGAGISTLFVALAWPVVSSSTNLKIGPMVAVGALTFVIYSLGSTSQAMFMRAMNFRDASSCASWSLSWPQACSRSPRRAWGWAVGPRAPANHLDDGLRSRSLVALWLASDARVLSAKCFVG